MLNCLACLVYSSCLSYLFRSIGCTFVEMLTTKPPYSEFEPMTAIYNIGAGRIAPRIPENVSDGLRDLLQQCFKRDPRFRPAATDLLSHPFFAVGRFPSDSNNNETNENDSNVILGTLIDVKDKLKRFFQKCINMAKKVMRQCIFAHC